MNKTIFMGIATTFVGLTIAFNPNTADDIIAGLCLVAIGLVIFFIGLPSRRAS